MKLNRFKKIEENLFISLDKNFLVLTMLLLLRTKPFNFHGKSYNKYLKFIPGNIMKVFRVIRIMLKLLLENFNINNSREGDLFCTTHDGHLLIKTSNGYKVFNLKEKIVYTQFLDNKVDIYNNINNLIYLGKLGISPIIKGADIEKNYFKEEYHNFYKAKHDFPISTYFYKNIFPIWERNTELYLETIGLEEYVTTQKSFILKSIRQLNKEGYPQEYLVNISDFVNFLSTKIMDYSDEKILTTLSHGDLHAWNVLLSKKNTILIDWDTFKERSVYHDLFYMFFYNIFGKKHVDFKGFKLELEHCIQKGSINIANKYSNNKYFGNNEFNRLYRMLFYLEYVYLDFEKRIDMLYERAKIQARLRKINNCVMVFQNFEKNAIENSEQEYVGS